MWTLEIVFKRQKTSAEGHSKTLSQSDLVFINPGIYLHSMATVIGKSAKKQFPAYVGEFWSISQRLLEILSPWYGDSDREKCQKAISGLRGRILEHITAFAGDI